MEFFHDVFIKIVRIIEIVNNTSVGIEVEICERGYSLVSHDVIYFSGGQLKIEIQSLE